MNMSSIKRLTLVIIAVVAALSATAQVDGEVSKPDTLFIIEDEITYDTLYLYDEGMDLQSKEGLLEALKRDRGVGRLYYDKGHMFINGTDALYRLNNADLEELLPPGEYAKYRKAKRNGYISIPFYVAGGTCAAFAGIGLYQFFASFVQTAQAHNQLLQSDDLGVNIWRSAMGGVFLFGGGLLGASAFFVPAIVLSIKSKVNINQVIDDFNAPATKTAMQLRFGPTPGGAGLTLSF